jgi:hypothetical protein
MADATEAPAGTSYDDHHADGNATLSREEHLQAAGEHMAAAHKLHAQLDDHHDAIGEHIQAVHDEDGRGGDGERSAPLVLARSANLSGAGAATHAAIMRSYRGR